MSLDKTGSGGQRVAFASACMVFSAGIASLVHVGVRVVGSEIPILEVAFVRALIGTIVLLPLIMLGKFGGSWRTRALRLQIIRGVVSTVAIVLWFYALTTVPLAQVVALSFTSSIFVTIGAALFLREKVRLRRWSAVACGLAGAFVILRPGFVEISLGSIAVMLGSVFWGASVLTAKHLARYDSNVTIVFYTTLQVALLTALPAFVVWEEPSSINFLILAATGIAGSTAFIAFTSALRHADATVTVPADFTRLVWGTLFGYLIFNERPDIYTWVGAAMIISASLFIAYREARLESASRQVIDRQRKA